METQGKKKLGVVGGLGPMTGARFMQLLTEQTAADADQSHIETILYSVPSVPDRTSYILGSSHDSPVPHLINALSTLENLGVDNAAIACVTAHYFYDELEASISIPLLNMIDITVGSILNRPCISKVGITATSGTIRTGLFQNALERAGLSWTLPTVDDQKTLMFEIYDHIKAGKPVDMEAFFRVAANLADAGAEAVILGCTELSLPDWSGASEDGSKQGHTYCEHPPFIDALRMLAEEAIIVSGYRVKK